MPRELYIGIMSGTSLDGIDAAVCEFLGDPPNTVTLLGQASIPWPPILRDILHSLATEENVSLDTLTRVHFLLSEFYATVVAEALKDAHVQAGDVTAIGLHGQTIRHLPQPSALWPGGPTVAGTLQIGSGPALAALTGVDVVSDFRSADVALGGQGAPLVPMFDNAFLRSSSIDRIALNIGGISNLTWLPSKTEANVVAFDTGPGNMMIDALTRRYFDTPYDADGNIAQSGAVNEDLVNDILSHPYFSAAPPKSTGRELFGRVMLQRFEAEVEAGRLSSDDAVATATEVTARSVADAVRYLTSDTVEILASGGGAKNLFLLDRLRSLLPFAQIETTDGVGIPVQSKEAIAFAYFAYAFVHSMQIHLPQTTGASRSLILGSLSRGR